MPICQEPFKRLVVQHRLRQHLLQTPVLILKRLETLGFRRLHTTILRAPFVQRRLANTVPAAKVTDFLASLILFQNPNDLLFGETAFSHLSSSRTKIKQILLSAGLISGGWVRVTGILFQQTI